MKTVESRVDGDALRRRAAYQLGFAGVLPFASLILAQFLEPSLGEDWTREVERWIVIYGVSIVGFMGGGRWVYRLQQPDARPGIPFGGLLQSVTPPLIAWLAAAAPDDFGEGQLTPMVRLVIIALLLMLQLAQEWDRRAGMEDWYFELRVMLAGGAAGSIIIAAGLAPFFRG